MSKIGQAIIDRLDNGEDVDEIIEKGLQNDNDNK